MTALETVDEVVDAEVDDLPVATVDILRQLAERDGELTAETVLAEATNPESPLHARFQWDDGVAAHEWRLHQARRIIGRIHVVLFEQPVRGYTFIPSTGSYRPVAEAMSNTTYRDEVMARFRTESAAFAAKWRNHKAICDEFRKWAQEMADS